MGFFCCLTGSKKLKRVRVILTIMRKDTMVLELFFNEPTRHWHFEEILKAAGISRPQAAHWLKKFVKEDLVNRVKPQGKMPYYVANHEHPHYRTAKRLFALDSLAESGFLNHLAGLPKAETILLFGSMSRSDWYSESDVDVFIYGRPEGLQLGRYRRVLKREISTFVCRNKAELKKYEPALLRNILEGHLVKGTLDFIDVVVHA